MRQFKTAKLPALDELKIHYVKWTGNNFNEIRDFIECFKKYERTKHDIYVCVTREGVPNLFIDEIGEVRPGDYIVSGNTRRNNGYDKLYVSSRKDLPYDVVGDDLKKERETIVYKDDDYWKEFLFRVLPFLNSDEEKPPKDNVKKELADKTLFIKIVKQLVKMYDNKTSELEDKIYALQEEIEKTGLGEAWFWVTKGDITKIDFGNFYSKDFYAEYYDGNQAPFIVCEWKGTIEQFQELIQKCDICIEL